MRVPKLWHHGHYSLGTHATMHETPPGYKLMLSLWCAELCQQDLCSTLKKWGLSPRGALSYGSHSAAENPGPWASTCSYTALLPSQGLCLSGKGPLNQNGAGKFLTETVGKNKTRRVDVGNAWK